MNKVTGTVHVIDPAQEFGQKGFRKRLLVLRQDFANWTNYIAVWFAKEGCDKLDSLNVGDVIDVEFRLSGRKYQRDESSPVKWFTDVEGVDFAIQGGTPSGEDGTPF